MSEIITDHSSTLFMEAGSLRQTQSSQVRLILLASWLWRTAPHPGFYLLRLELQAGCHAHPPSMCMGFLGPIHMHGILTLVLAFV